MGDLQKKNEQATLEWLEYYLDFLAYMIGKHAPRFDACISIYDRIVHELKQLHESQDKRADINQRLMAL